MHTKAFEHMACGNWKRIVTLQGALCIKDTSLLRTIYHGPVVSVIQRFHCIRKLAYRIAGNIGGN